MARQSQHFGRKPKHFGKVPSYEQAYLSKGAIDRRLKRKSARSKAESKGWKLTGVDTQARRLAEAQDRSMVNGPKGKPWPGLGKRTPGSQWSAGGFKKGRVRKTPY